MKNTKKQISVYVGADNRTKEINKTLLNNLLSKRYKGYTLIDCFGYWNSEKEKSVKIELIGDLNTQQFLTFCSETLIIGLNQFCLLVTENYEMGFKEHIINNEPIKEKPLNELQNDFKQIIISTEHNPQKEFNRFILGLKLLDKSLLGFSLSWFLDSLRAENITIDTQIRLKVFRLLNRCDFFNKETETTEHTKRQNGKMNVTTGNHDIFYNFIKGF